MKKTLIVVGIIGAVAILGSCLIGGSIVSILNREGVLKVTLEAKQEDNKNQMDGMWKTIAQVGEVAEKDRETLSNIFKDYASARSGNGDSKVVFNWIKEAVPNVQVNSDTFKNLQNIILSQRDGFKMRQTELLDLNREHNQMFRIFPANVFLSMFGRKETQVVIVTSTRTDNAFKSGKDDDVNVFQNNK